MIKLVIFDMDGLLIDSEPLWERSYQQVFKDFGMEFTDADYMAAQGRRTGEVIHGMYRQKPWEGPSPEEVTDKVIDELVGLVKSEGSLLPGVHHALSVCKKAGLPVAIASSSAQKIIDAVVDTLEIREHFKHIYSAQFERYGKPHPGVFITVAEHFKVPPAECLVFEDSAAGVLAAKSAGMLCIAVPDDQSRNHPFVRTADATLPSLEEFDETMLRRVVLKK